MKEMRTWGRPEIRGSILCVLYWLKSRSLREIEMSAGWHFVSLILSFYVVGSPELPYIRHLVVSAAGLNCRNPSSIPRRVEHQSVNSSKTVKFLFKTNDGRGGRLNWAILSATYASAKTQEGEGVSHHTACMGNYY